ncbi:MAG: peptide ABC transporter ATP-binding protein [Desulfuromonas sp.]|nr:MAG: peptide ABC transporter ATP-binding protein [Desulfuromonas sp.]
MVSSGRPGTTKAALRAVDGISFDIFPGETLGLVGESGCGKSTTGKLIMRLLEPDAGSISFLDQPLLELSKSQLLAARRNLQMIFQDPFSSLNPRMKIGEIVGEPLKIHRLVEPGKMRLQVTELLQTVGLSPDHADRYPHEFSGGQRQRVGIARALAVKPKLIVADEPVSALDLSIQAQIVNLLQDLQDEFKLTYLLIAHDLGVIAHLCNRVAVMYLGRIVELGPADMICATPAHPYTEALLNAVPVPDPTRRRQRLILSGEIPSPINPPSGCHFHPRCPYAKELCQNEAPKLVVEKPGHQVACHFSDEVGKYRI